MITIINYEFASYAIGLMHGAAVVLFVLMGIAWWQNREPKAYRVPKAQLQRAQRLALAKTAMVRRMS